MKKKGKKNLNKKPGELSELIASLGRGRAAGGVMMSGGGVWLRFGFSIKITSYDKTSEPSHVQRRKPQHVVGLLAPL